MAKAEAPGDPGGYMKSYFCRLQIIFVLLLLAKNLNLEIFRAFEVEGIRLFDEVPMDVQLAGKIRSVGDRGEATRE